jgi:hypothetical protein
VTPAPETAALDALLRRLLSRHGGRQMFVFGHAGEPFWAAHVPLSPSDLAKLDHALALIESTERTRPKPFFVAEDHLVVAALDEAADLYFVVLYEPGPVAAEARVAAMRAELRPHAVALLGAQNPDRPAS